MSNETKQKNKSWPSNTIVPSSSKSRRKLKEPEVVPHTATTIATSNLQGTAHDIIQKEALT